MLLNDKSLTNHKDGLSNSFNLTNHDPFVRLVDENKTKKTTASLSFLQAVPSLSRPHFDFLSFLRPATQAMATNCRCFMMGLSNYTMRISQWEFYIRQQTQKETKGCSYCRCFNSHIPTFPFNALYAEQSKTHEKVLEANKCRINHHEKCGINLDFLIP